MGDKLDIFDELGAIDTWNRDFYANLSDELKKQFVPYVVMKWMTGVNDDLQLIMLNEFVNPYMFALANHKDLLYKLLTATANSNGKKRRHIWAKKEKVAKNELAIKIISEYYECALSEAELYFPLLSVANIKEYAETLGYDPKELKQLDK